MRSFRVAGALALVLLALALAPAQNARASAANVAALQAGLTGLGLYDGCVDGIRGPLTRRGVLALQRRRGLGADGIAGRRTRRALGWRGRPGLDSRVMRRGNRGWDVAALQFLLQRAGRGPGRADGVFGSLTEGAVRRAQRRGGIGIDGLAGPVTIRSLRGGRAGGPAPPGGPVRFLRPVAGPLGDRFGVARGGGRTHDGIDFPVAYGTPVGAAGVGTTIFAAHNYGGYGNLVVVQHRLGFTSWYAHLSSIATAVGQRVAGGTRIGYVGSSGYSTGPHLHFEVRRYNTPIDPLPRLLDIVALRSGGSDRRAPTDDCRRARRPDRAAPPGASWLARERLCAK